MTTISLVVAVAPVGCGGTESEVAEIASAVEEGGGLVDGGQRGAGTYGGWGGYLGEINGTDGAASPTGSYTAVEVDPRSGTIMGLLEGRDLNGDGYIDRDEFGDVDQGIFGTDNPVGVVDVDLCCFHANLPEPIEAPRNVTLHWPQWPLVAYFEAWRDSPLRDALTDYASRHVSLRLTTVDSPSMYVPATRTVYISLADLNSHGIVALDHELMLAGLRIGRAERVITRQQFRRLNRLHARRFPDLNGYVGSIHGLHDQDGFGAAKAFVVGEQYNKLMRVRDQVDASQRPFVDLYISEVEGNAILGRLADGRRLRLISSGATQATIDHFLTQFTRPGAITHDYIASVLARYPAVPAQPPLTPELLGRYHSESDGT